MDRDDRDDPFDEFFEELERMLQDVMGPGGGENVGVGGAGTSTGPHVSVYEEDDAVRVIADLPGVDEDALSLTCDGEHLTIAVSAPGQEVTEQVALPTPVDEHSATATFNNGVLEVVLEKSDGSADIRLD